MPVSTRHEAMHRMFQEPDMFGRAVRAAGYDMPEILSARVVSNDCTTYKGLGTRHALQRTVDTAMLYETVEGPMIIGFEAQRSIQLGKPATWLYYSSVLNQQHDAPPLIVVICHNRTTARWAELWHHLGPLRWPRAASVKVIVLGPHNIPAITDPAEAAADLWLACLSAITHAEDLALCKILDALGHAIRALADDAEKSVFYDFIQLGLGEGRAAQKWSTIMVMDTSFLHSPFFQGVRAEGFEEGEAVGELKGEAKGRATAILEVLLCRGVATSPKNRERIETCMDLAALSTWLRNAMTANTIDEVFG